MNEHQRASAIGAVLGSVRRINQHMRELDKACEKLGWRNDLINLMGKLKTEDNTPIWEEQIEETLTAMIKQCPSPMEHFGAWYYGDDSTIDYVVIRAVTDLKCPLYWRDPMYGYNMAFPEGWTSILSSATQFVPWDKRVKQILSKLNTHGKHAEFIRLSEIQQALDSNFGNWYYNTPEV